MEIVISESIYDLKLLDINQQEVDMAKYRGKVLLIVNVASYCGYTKQYKGLQKLYDQYNSQGFEILAFPCNQFGEQEPGTNEEIKEFCSNHYNITFKIMDKIDVNGENTSPIYRLIKSALNVNKLEWNFEKFVINRNGGIAQRFNSQTNPDSLSLVIKTYLDQHTFPTHV